MELENRIYAYGRVSTKEQNEERQRVAFMELGIEDRNIYIDKQSGKDFKRDKYEAVVNSLRKNDTLVVKSIDRLGRNYDAIKTEWDRISNEIGAFIKIIDTPLLDTTNQDGDLTGKLISDIVLQLLAYVAEQERNFNRQRQAEGIAVMPVVDGKKVSLKTGRPTGRPTINQPKDWDKVYKQWITGKITANKAMSDLGLKRNSFYKLAEKSGWVSDGTRGARRKTRKEADEDDIETDDLDGNEVHNIDIDYSFLEGRMFRPKVKEYYIDGQIFSNIEDIKK